MDDENRIKRLLEEVSTPETSDEDPYHDDGGEYGSDDDYNIVHRLFPILLLHHQPYYRYNYSSDSNDDNSSVRTSVLPQINAEEQEQPAPPPPEMTQSDFTEFVQPNFLEHQLPESLEQIHQPGADNFQEQISERQETSAANLEQLFNGKGLVLSTASMDLHKNRFQCFN